MLAFPNIMSEFREASGLTLRELSAIVNVSAGQLSNYERGTSRPKKDTVIAISKAIDLPTDTALLAAGYSPVYSNGGDAEMVRAVEETAAHFGLSIVYNRVIPLMQEVAMGENMLELRKTIAETGANSTIPSHIVSALTKADVALKLLEDAASELMKARYVDIRR